MDKQVIVVGAGVAGLACARRLSEEGRDVLVLDKARGVGGRCATRRFDEQPVDFGVLFFHGHEPSFLAALEAVEQATPLAGWPLRVNDSGTPCQFEAFTSYGRRLAFAEGVSAFPKHLARGLDVRLNTRVRAVTLTTAGFAVELEDDDRLEAQHLVLALPLEQALELLAALPVSEALDSVRALLAMMATVPCLTLIAGYPPDAPAPDWDISFPSTSKLLMLIGHESSKRDNPAAVTMVYQARAHYSAQHLEQPPEPWGRELLAEAAARLGDWAAEPLWTHHHRWRFARVDSGNELAAPILLRLAGGQRLGIAGDVFAPGGGVQAAWLSGRGLADRLAHEVTA